MKNILTGLQPSGKLHLGNYFGAIEPILNMQESEDNLMLFIANYHALTTVQNKDILKKNTYDAVLDLLSLGIDIDKTTFFVQSSVPEVLELNLILSNLTSIGSLERAHSYKDKIANGIKPNHGLFSYPILMAADILLYNTDLVPVGKDQIQHVEMARDIATRFNEVYGKTFKLPEFKIEEDKKTLLGIDGRKMSKSYDNTIPLFIDDKSLKKIISKIKTDSTPLDEIKNYENCIIFSIASLIMSEDELEELKEMYLTPGKGYGHFKEYLFLKLLDYFAEAKEKRLDFLSNPEYVKEVIHIGQLKARNIACEKLYEVKEKVGLF